MTIKGQINVCLHNLNVLYEMVLHRRSEDWDLQWQLDQIDHARALIEQLKDGDNNDSTRSD